MQQDVGLKEKSIMPENVTYNADLHLMHVRAWGKNDKEREDDETHWGIDVGGVAGGGCGWC